jgi:hypothetical protein
MGRIKQPFNPEKRCTKCQGKQQCGRCAGITDANAARKKRHEEEKSSNRKDPRLEGNRKRLRDAYRAEVAVAKAQNRTPKGVMCKGVDSRTGNPCTNVRRNGCSVDGSQRCKTCYEAAKGQLAYTTLLRERHDALPKCVGINKGMACKYRIGQRGGILAALRRTGTTSSETREAVKTEPSIQRLVAAYDMSRMCVTCFKKNNTGLGKELKNLTACNADDESCQRIAVLHGLCGHHHALSLPASSTLCAGEYGDGSCESGQPRKPSKGNLCKPCFDAMTARMIAECQAARPAKRQRRLEEQRI